MTNTEFFVFNFGLFGLEKVLFTPVSGRIIE